MFALKTVAIRADGCFSALLCDGRPFAVTCERTFDNLRPVIGNGLYRCTKTLFARGQYETFEIAVPGHTRVLLHRGNVEPDSEGCILVGKSFGLINGKTAVLDSKAGFDEFWKLASPFDAFDLLVSGR